MINRTHSSSYLSFRPSLVHEDHGGSEVGYLKLSPSHEPIKIGPVNSAEYRLIESLFGPAEGEARSANRFHALSDTTENVYSNVTHTNPLDGVYVSSRMRDVINTSIARVIERVRRTEAGKYLAFTLTDRHLMMKIHPGTRTA